MEAAVATEAPKVKEGYTRFPDLHPCFACGKRREQLKEKKGEYFCANCLGTSQFEATADHYRWDLRTTEIHTPLPSKLLPSNLAWGLECEVDFSEVSHRRYMPLLLQKLKSNTVFGSKDDASLNEGIEFYSPILSGDRGVEELKKFCTFARFLPINDHCGLHVHLDARKLSWHQLHKIYWVYAVAEPAILQMLPPQRRQNQYCHRIHQSHKGLMAKIKSQEDFNLVYLAHCKVHRLSALAKSRLAMRYENGGGNTRNFHYDGINLHNYFYNRSQTKKTIEIRYHSGTVEFEKIYHWLVFNLAIVKFAFLQPQDFQQILPKRISETKRFVRKLLDNWPETLKYIEGRWKQFAKE